MQTALCNSRIAQGRGPQPATRTRSPHLICADLTPSMNKLCHSVIRTIKTVTLSNTTRHDLLIKGCEGRVSVILYPKLKLWVRVFIYSSKMDNLRQTCTLTC